MGTPVIRIAGVWKWNAVSHRLPGSGTGVGPPANTIIIFELNKDEVTGRLCRQGVRKEVLKGVSVAGEERFRNSTHDDRISSSWGTVQGVEGIEGGGAKWEMKGMNY